MVHGKTTEDHDRNLVAKLNRLQERNLTLNKDKCKIGMNQIVFMGLLLNKHAVGPTEETAQAIRETEPPNQCHRVAKLSWNCQFQFTVPA